MTIRAAAVVVLTLMTTAAQAQMPCAGRADALGTARVLAVEHRIYPRALRLVAEGRAKFGAGGDEGAAR